MPWFLLLVFLASSALAQNCGGLPRLEVSTPQGFCVGVVAKGLNFPRGILPLPGGDLLVVEMGGWTRNKGRITRLSQQADYRATRLFSGLDRPNGITLGPDGKVYVGEVGKIFRFSPGKPVKEYVIQDLPGTGRHPLTQMVFDSQGNLLVNVGSASDNCDTQKSQSSCSEAQTRGLVRRYSFSWPGGKVGSWSVLARGLRNSMALAVHESGSVLQGENSRDAINVADPKISDEDHPNDEINVLSQGSSYGWPYCYENGKNAPEFAKYDCTKTQNPAFLLPAHTAPLGMAYWKNGPAEYAGWLVVGFHGYRAKGHRLVGLEVNDKGIPTGKSVELIKNWNLAGGKIGAPVDVKMGQNGQVFISDDQNGMVLMLSRL